MKLLKWVAYGIGHLISFPMVKFDWAWLYPVYNRLMLFSWDSVNVPQ
jgi:hypothetical protein